MSPAFKGTEQYLNFTVKTIVSFTHTHAAGSPPRQLPPRPPPPPPYDRGLRSQRARNGADPRPGSTPTHHRHKRERPQTDDKGPNANQQNRILSISSERPPSQILRRFRHAKGLGGPRLSHF